MGRRAGFVLGLLGFLLPGYLFYIIAEVIFRNITILYIQGLFYFFRYERFPNGRTETELELITRDWFSADKWGSNTEFYLYLASFTLALLGLIVVIFRHENGGALFILLAGILSLALMSIQSSTPLEFLAILTLRCNPVVGLGLYTKFWLIQYIPTTIYPIPVGAIFLILSGFFGRKS